MEHDERPYSNRELREFFGDIKQDLGEIKQQTIVTNGRVTSLEKWQSFIMGGLAILSLLVVPVLIYVITLFIKT